MLVFFITPATNLGRTCRAGLTLKPSRAKCWCLAFYFPPSPNRKPGYAVTTPGLSGISVSYAGSRITVVPSPLAGLPDRAVTQYPGAIVPRARVFEPGGAPCELTCDHPLWAEAVKWYTKGVRAEIYHDANGSANSTSFPCHVFCIRPVSMHARLSSMSRVALSTPKVLV